MNAESTSVGQKIKQFRLRAGLSQMDLELEVGLAPGSLSRIESGKVNPTKETLLLLAEFLDLDDLSTAKLFEITIDTPRTVLDIVNTLSIQEDIEELMHLSVEEISNRLNFFSVGIFLLHGKTIHARYLSDNTLNRNVMSIIGKPFNNLSLSEDKDPKNLLLRSALDGKLFISNDLYDFGRGILSQSTLHLIQKLVGMKKGIAIPLIHREKSFGSMIFVKKEENDYSYEIPILESLAKQIAFNIVNLKYLHK